MRFFRATSLPIAGSFLLPIRDFFRRISRIKRNDGSLCCFNSHRDNAIETGDEEAVTVVNPHKYIQHNPETHEGGEGLAALFKRIARTSPRVDVVRVFSDGDYVFAHTEYDFSSVRVGFEKCVDQLLGVFRHGYSLLTGVIGVQKSMVTHYAIKWIEKSNG